MKIKAGEAFNSWTVVSPSKNRGTRKVWLCKCKCGTEKEVYEQNLKNNKSKSCGCYVTEKFWKGHGDISMTYWSALKNGAKSRDIEFLISIKEAWDIFLLQNKKCALSNEKIYFAKSTSVSKRKLGTASMDRIDSSLGYTKNNCQWVHKSVNRLKMDMKQDDFLLWCHKISKNNQ